MEIFLPLPPFFFVSSWLRALGKGLVRACYFFLLSLFRLLLASLFPCYYLFLFSWSLFRDQDSTLGFFFPLLVFSLRWGLLLLLFFFSTFYFFHGGNVVVR